MQAYPALGWVLALMAASLAFLAAAFAWGFLSSASSVLFYRSRRPPGDLGPPARDEAEKTEAMPGKQDSSMSPLACGVFVMAIGALGVDTAIRDFFPSEQPYYLSQWHRRRVEPEFRLLAHGGVFALGLAVVVTGRRAR